MATKQHMTEFELQILKELSDIKTTAAIAAATAQALEHRLFNVVGDIPSMKIELKGLQDDLTNRVWVELPALKVEVETLKETAKSDVWWDRAKTALAPLLVGLHIAVRALGVHI